MSIEKNNKVTLYLMRHGETILNRAGRTQGWCDGVLTKEGIETAINTGLGLSNIDFKAAYSSDLGRAVKTAEIVIKENTASKNLKLIKSEDLREVYFGKYEGGLDEDFYKDILNYLNVKSFEEAEKIYDLQKEFCNACAALDETKEAENYDKALNRFLNFLNKICESTAKSGGGNILIVTHGGIMRLILDYFNTNNLNVRNLVNCSISIIEYKNGCLTTKKINDTSYTEQGRTIRSI